MKKFYTYGIENNNLQKPINESFGTLILGLLAVLGITLGAAIRACANSYDDEPDIDPEDLEKARQQLREYNEGTRKVYEEMQRSIEEAKKKEEEAKNNKNDNATPPPLPEEDKNSEKDKNDKSKGESGENPEDKLADTSKDKSEENPEDKLDELDKKDKYTKQLIDVMDTLKLSDDALMEKSSKVKILFDYLTSSGTISKEIEEENKKLSEEGKIDTADINQVMAHFVAKYYLDLRSEDKNTYTKLFKDPKTLSAIQELICFQMILHNNNTSIKEGTYINLGKILEIL